MNVDVNLILAAMLGASVIGHIITGFWNYKILLMVLRALSPTLRHRNPGPMPPLFVDNKTDEFDTSSLNGSVRSHM